MRELRINIQFFAEESVNDLMDYLGVTPQDDGSQDNTDGANTDTSATDTNEDDANNNEETDNEQNGQEDNNKNDQDGTNSKEDQKAFAFAQLRKEAQQKNQLVNGLQKLLGIPENTPLEDVMTKVQEAVVKAQAKQTGIPEEFINKLNTLEQRDKEYRASQLRDNALMGFNKIQKEFKLDSNEVKTFANELLQNGINPLETEVDVLAEYKVRHFDDILTKKVQEGIRAEQERAAKAGSQSTQPGSTQGQTKGEQGKINSIKDLDSWLNQNQKK